MEKTIYIIRHGQTDLNKRGVVQGRGVNAELNEYGWKQANAFYAAYKDVPFDKIYTSTLIRTHQTVQNFIKLGIPWVQFPGLDELDWGVCEGQDPTDEMKIAFNEMLIGWAQGDLNLKFENGESPLDLQERQLEVIDYLVRENEAKNILVCMHGRAMRLFLCLLTKKAICEMDDFPHENTTLYKLHYDGQEFKVIDFHNIDHLKSLSEQD